MGIFNVREGLRLIKVQLSGILPICTSTVWICGPRMRALLKNQKSGMRIFGATIKRLSADLLFPVANGHWDFEIRPPLCTKKCPAWPPPRPCQRCAVVFR